MTTEADRARHEALHPLWVACIGYVQRNDFDNEWSGYEVYETLGGAVIDYFPGSGGLKVEGTFIHGTRNGDKAEKTISVEFPAGLSSESDQRASQPEHYLASAIMSCQLEVDGARQGQSGGTVGLQDYSTFVPLLVHAIEANQ